MVEAIKKENRIPENRGIKRIVNESIQRKILKRILNSKTITKEELDLREKREKLRKLLSK